MTSIGEHTHSYTKFKYIRLGITNPKYIDGKGKRILKVKVCDCGHEIGLDLLDKMPERKTNASNKSRRSEI